MGKTPVIVKDSPGFVVNRILMPYLDEAVRLVGEGIPTERVDHTMKRFGMPMGPLELLDQIGLDVAAHVAASMGPTMKARFPPNAIFGEMLERGWLGLKSSVGFYRYRGKAKKPHAAVVALLRGAAGDGLTAALPAAAQMREARDRLVLLMVNEAVACLDEGLVESSDTIDLAMVLGTGWAPHRGGPLHYGQDRGYAEIVKTMVELAGRLGSRFNPCAGLHERAAKGSGP
jgi:3-hydroxyacyl-CoA dehydrogenase/enoyl-CoA hydratase/3-hydroxybutyryl-CoA epimerase